MLKSSYRLKIWLIFYFGPVRIANTINTLSISFLEYDYNHFQILFTNYSLTHSSSMWPIQRKNNFCFFNLHIIFHIFCLVYWLKVTSYIYYFQVLITFWTHTYVFIIIYTLICQVIVRILQTVKYVYDNA